jgi:TrkA-C domain
MTGIYWLMPVLLIIFISVLIVRAAAVILIMTGMDPIRARFQALSAFTRTGFTTSEAETVVRHPVRRRVIIWLMILGNAGIITVMVTATSAFVLSRGVFVAVNGVFLIIGIIIIWIVAKHAGLTARWERFVESRFLKSPAVEDIYCEDLTHLAAGWGFLRVLVSKGSRLVSQRLSQLEQQGNFEVLGIERDGRWIPLSKREQSVEVGDSLIVFGLLNEAREYFLEKTPASS